LTTSKDTHDTVLQILNNKQEEILDEEQGVYTTTCTLCPAELPEDHKMILDNQQRRLTQPASILSSASLSCIVVEIMLARCANSTGVALDNALNAGQRGYLPCSRDKLKQDSRSRTTSRDNLGIQV
jgi:hypothetical protein